MSRRRGEMTEVERSDGSWEEASMREMTTSQTWCHAYTNLSPGVFVCMMCVCVLSWRCLHGTICRVTQRRSGQEGVQVQHGPPAARSTFACLWAFVIKHVFCSPHLGTSHYILHSQSLCLIPAIYESQTWVQVQTSLSPVWIRNFNSNGLNLELSNNWTWFCYCVHSDHTAAVRGYMSKCECVITGHF